MDLQSNKKLDFSGQAIYVGLDVHKKSWKVTIMTTQHEHKTFTQVPQAATLAGYLRRHFPFGDYHCAYEAGFSGFGACRQLQGLGVACLVVNPADVPSGDKERRRKNDRVDSRKLARSLRNGELAGIYVPSVEQQEDRSLLRTRSAMVKDVTRCKNRIKSFLNFQGIELPAPYDKPGVWSRGFIDWLQQVELASAGGRQSLLLLLKHLQESRGTLLEATRQMRALSRSTGYAHQLELLRSVPGIGVLTAMVFLTEIGDIRRFKDLDALCGYVGVVPDQRGSGDREVTSGLTPRHNGLLFKQLVESARVAVRKDPALMQSYDAYCKRMSANKAIVRIMRKLLARVRHILLADQHYQLGQVV